MNLRRNNFPIYAAIAVLILVLLITPLFFRKNLSMGEYVSAVWRIPSLLDENQSLRMQVEDQKNEILCVAQNDTGNGSRIASGMTEGDSMRITAKVYSLYPFNTKSRIFLGSGTESGIAAGQPVLASQTVLVGAVRNVSAHRSEVATLYDTSFALPVRVGKSEVDALLQGGISPRLTLIDKTKTIVSGDKIISASKDMPYGLTVGSVEDVREDSSGAFLETSIRVPYNLNALRTVFILKNE
jgi:rod shape-determining protein MreC